MQHVSSVNPSNQTGRYTQVARREIQAGSPRQPQWVQAVDRAGGNLAAATQHYVSTRVMEISDSESEHEAAQERLRKLRQFNDDLTLTGTVKVALFGVPLVLILFSCLIRWFAK